DTKQIDFSINNLNARHKLASINRAAGWISYRQTNSKKPEILGQIDAGSGSLSSIPTKNISGIIGQNDENYTLILRAQAAGINDVDFYSDVTFGEDSSKMKLYAALNVK
ncbi:MAG: hypothetical protein CUN55_21030, partial [Phototrophicales bacterium]